MTYSVHSNYHIINHLSERNLIRTYAYFLKFKYVFSSSRLHRGNKAKLSRITGVSEKNVRIQIGKMRELGWIKEVNGDYIFISKNEMYGLYDLDLKKRTFKCKILTSSDDSIKNIITKLSSKLIEWNIKKQQNCINLKEKYVRYLINSRVSESDDVNSRPHVKRSPVSRKEKARLRSLRKSHRMGFVSEQKTTSLSSYGFSRVLNVSLSAANRLKSQMISLNLISVQSRYKSRDISYGAIQRMSILRSQGLAPVNKFCKNMKMFTRISDAISINYNYNYSLKNV